MFNSRVTWRHGIVALIVVASVAWLSASYERTPHLRHPRISSSSAEDRRESLEALKLAWAQRPLELTPEHAREEKNFINRVGFFSAATQRREIANEVFSFYQKTAHDFFNRYGSEDILDKDT